MGFRVSEWQVFSSLIEGSIIEDIYVYFSFFQPDGPSSPSNLPKFCPGNDFPFRFSRHFFWSFSSLYPATGCSAMKFFSLHLWISWWLIKTQISIASKIKPWEKNILLPFFSPGIFREKRHKPQKPFFRLLSIINQHYRYQEYLLETIPYPFANECIGAKPLFLALKEKY